MECLILEEKYRVLLGLGLLQAECHTAHWEPGIGECVPQEVYMLVPNPSVLVGVWIMWDLAKVWRPFSEDLVNTHGERTRKTSRHGDVMASVSGMCLLKAFQRAEYPGKQRAATAPNPQVWEGFFPLYIPKMQMRQVLAEGLPCRTFA